MKGYITKEQLSDNLKNELSEFSSQLEHIEKYNNVIDLSKLGVASENIVFDQQTNKYLMTDYSDTLVSILKLKPSVLILPEGNILIEKPIDIEFPIEVIGHNTRIFKSPSIENDSIFNICSSDVSITGVSFYSEKKYLVNMKNDDAKAITSNINTINIYGAINNIAIKNCCSENISMFIGINFANNITIENCKCVDGYISIYAGSNAENIFIRNCEINQQLDTDVYANALYFDGCVNNVIISDTTLVQEGENSANIIKVGSSIGKAENVSVVNCNIYNKTNASLFYIENDSDLTIKNSYIKTSSFIGYSRLFQINNNSTFKAKNCEFLIDSYDRYTQKFNLLNSKIEFDNCNINVKNTIEKYSNLPFVSGADSFKFRGCNFDFDLSLGINLMNQEMASVDILNCYIKYNSIFTLGHWDKSSVIYTKSNNPRLRMYNTVLDNNSETQMNGNILFGNFKNDDYSAECHLSNVTVYRGVATSGSEIGRLFKSDSENDYIKNNVVDISVGSQ